MDTQLEPGATTFARLLRANLDSGTMHRDDSVLVQFAGEFDQRVCDEVGLTNVLLANIAPDSRGVGDAEPLHMDAHRMQYDDASFDHVIGHSGLHHCSRPHEALHEMYRVARKTVLFVENQDSVMMRLASKLGVVHWHEWPAVVGGDYVSGGVDGTGVPNFIYRWTRRELRKTVAAFDPGYDVPVEIFTEWNLGMGRVSSTVLQQKLRLDDDQAARAFATGQRMLNRVAGRQGNIFAGLIRKDLATLQPWMSSPTEMHRES